MEKVVDILIRRRKPIFIGFLLTILLALFALPFPEFSGSLRGFELDTDHSVKIDEFNKPFGQTQKIYLEVNPSSDDKRAVFANVIKLEQNIQKEFQQISVLSLASQYRKLASHWKKRNNSLKDALEEASDVPLLDQLVSADHSSFLLVVSTDAERTFDLDRFNLLLEEEYEDIASFRLLSLAHLERSIARHIIMNIQAIVAFIIVAFFLVIMGIFRSFYALVVASVIILLSLIVSLLVFNIFGADINMITVLAFPIVLILALSDAMHLLASYVKHHDFEKAELRLRFVLKRLIIPSFFSSATTAAAFFSFYLFSEAAYIREFGLITSIALMLEFILAFALAPVLLLAYNGKVSNDRPAIYLSSFFYKGRKVFSILFVLMLISSVFVANKLEFRSESDFFFPDKSTIQTTHEHFKDQYYTNLPLNIYLHVKDEVNDGSNQNGANEVLFSQTFLLHDMLKKEELVISSTSGTDAYFVRNKFGLMSNLFDSEDVQNAYYNSSAQVRRIELMMSSAEDIIRFNKDVLPSLLEELHPSIESIVKSPALDMDAMNQSVSTSLIKSLTTSGIAIFLMILLLTRSAGLSFLSLLPNLVPIAFVILLYHFAGMSINILTAMTAIICLGLLDDDTVHILYRKLILKEEMGELSLSILSSALMLIIGFSSFLISSFQPIRVMGGISALLFAVGVLCEMTLMQWILDRIKKK